MSDFKLWSRSVRYKTISTTWCNNWIFARRSQISSFIPYNAKSCSETINHYRYFISILSCKQLLWLPEVLPGVIRRLPLPGVFEATKLVLFSCDGVLQLFVLETEPTIDEFTLEFVTSRHVLIISTFLILLKAEINESLPWI